MEIKSRVQLVELMKDKALPLVAAEIGVAEGIFSQELLQLGIQKLYLIDVWERIPFIEGCASFDNEWHNKNYADMWERTQEYREKVVILKGFSYKMADEIPDNSLGLAYIDCDHTYLGTMTDINAFLPKLVTGGIMAFHDYGSKNYGVYRAVQNFTKGKDVFELLEDGNSDNFGAYFIKK